MKDVLNQLKGPAADPYFASRVIALAQAEKQKKQLFFWRSFASAMTVASLVLFLGILKSTSNENLDYRKAPVQKAMVLQLKNAPKNENIEYVSLEIDDDMIFDIENPLFQDKKEITVAVDSSKRLPFVFKSLKAGKKKVHIKFLDSEFNVVETNTEHLEFIETKL